MAHVSSNRLDGAPGDLLSRGHSESRPHHPPEHSPGVSEARYSAPSVSTGSTRAAPIAGSHEAINATGIRKGQRDRGAEGQSGSEGHKSAERFYEPEPDDTGFAAAFKKLQ